MEDREDVEKEKRGGRGGREIMNNLDALALRRIPVLQQQLSAQLRLRHALSAGTKCLLCVTTENNVEKN